MAEPLEWIAHFTFLQRKSFNLCEQITRSNKLLYILKVESTKAPRWIHWITLCMYFDSLERSFKLSVISNVTYRMWVCVCLYVTVHWIAVCFKIKTSIYFNSRKKKRLHTYTCIVQGAHTITILTLILFLSSSQAQTLKHIEHSNSICRPYSCARTHT